MDSVVLCGANSYEEKYYFNKEFDALPQAVKDELRILCVLYTEDIGGILLLEFDPQGSSCSGWFRIPETIFLTRLEAR